MKYALERTFVDCQTQHILYGSTWHPSNRTVGGCLWMRGLGMRVVISWKGGERDFNAFGYSSLRKGKSKDYKLGSTCGASCLQWSTQSEKLV